MITPARYAFWRNAYFLAVVVGIGGLQMYHVNAGILTNHGADLLAPPYLYLMARGGRLKLGPAGAFTLVLGACILWEWLQRYDLSGTPLAITHGRFDPLELVAYSVGMIAVYVLDVAWLAPRGLTPSARRDGASN